MVNQDDLKYIQILWDFMKLNQPLKKSDFIIVLGCADIKVADVAIDVYNQGLSDKIIFSGGLGKITKNIWKIPEANKKIKYKFSYFCMSPLCRKKNLGLYEKIYARIYRIYNV